MSLKNKIAILLFVIGGVVLIASIFQNKRTHETKPSPHLKPQDTHIDLSRLSNTVDYKKSHDALALFVVQDELCTSCINEIIEYTEAVENYVKSPLNGFKTLRHGLVVGDDSTDYRRINHLVKFEVPSSLIQKENPLTKKLSRWQNGKSGINQVVLIDLDRSKIVGRIGIFTISTTPVFKKNLVQEAFYELEKDNLNI